MCLCGFVVFLFLVVVLYVCYNMYKGIYVFDTFYRFYRNGGREMDERAKEARRAYKREWNRRNPDKVRAIQERYWSRKAEAAQRKADEPATQGA